MAIQNVVIHDEHIAKSIQFCAITVDDRGAVFGQPLVNFAQPVGFHHVRDDHQQRKGASHFCCNKCLRRLTQARFIGEEESAMPSAH